MRTNWALRSARLYLWCAAFFGAGAVTNLVAATVRPSWALLSAVLYLVCFAFFLAGAAAGRQAVRPYRWPTNVIRYEADAHMEAGE